MKISKLLKLDEPKSLLPIVVAIIAIGITRQLWWLYIAGLRGPLGLFSIPVVVCPFVVLVLFFAGSLISLIIWSIRQTKSVIPTLFLILGIVVAFIIPLSEPPDTPEKLHFIEHRTDYEAVVELARNLEEELNCFHLPEEFQYLIVNECVLVEWDTYHGRGLSVRFNPIENFYHPVVYVEFDEVDNPCGWDSYVEQRIDAHWYVCEHEWN